MHNCVRFLKNKTEDQGEYSRFEVGRENLEYFGYFGYVILGVSNGWVRGYLGGSF